MPPQATRDSNVSRTFSENTGQAVDDGKGAAARSPRAEINFLLTAEVHLEKKDKQTSPALSSDSAVSESESPSLSTFAPPPDGGEQLAPTRRRSRTVMTPHQTRLLHKVLEETYFPTAAQRESLSRLLQVPQRTIQIWFQNQRQKAKHQQNQASHHAGRCATTAAAHSPGTAAAVAAAAYSFQLQLRSLLGQLSPANAASFFATAKALYNAQHLGQVTPRMLTTILAVMQSQAKTGGEASSESPPKRRPELPDEDTIGFRLAPLYSRQHEETAPSDGESYSPSFEPVADGEELPSLKSLVSAAMNSPPLPVPCHMHSPPLSLKKMRTRENLLDVLVEASDSSAF